MKHFVLLVFIAALMATGCDRSIHLPGAISYVPSTRTINGKPLSGNIQVTKNDVGLANVTNESKATMFTSPTFTRGVGIADSLMFQAEANGEYQWLCVGKNGRAFGDYLEDVAGFGLTMDLPSLESVLSDRKNGEIGYYLSPTEVIYGLSKQKPSKQILLLWSADEMNKRWIRNLEITVERQDEEIQCLENRLTILESYIAKQIEEGKK